MGLVTCENIGVDLTKWLRTATELQKQELCEELGCSSEWLAANSDSIVITGDGSEGNPYVFSVVISPDEGNGLELRGNGLYAGAKPFPDICRDELSVALVTDIAWEFSLTIKPSLEPDYKDTGIDAFVFSMIGTENPAVTVGQITNGTWTPQAGSGGNQHIQLALAQFVSSSAVEIIDEFDVTLPIVITRKSDGTTCKIEYNRAFTAEGWFNADDEYCIFFNAYAELG